MNVVIIGAGQLGSRHLQGLKSSNIGMSIFLVDPSVGALAVALDRYDQIETEAADKSVALLESIELLPDDLDLVIIATNSGVRANVTRSLLSGKSVRNIVFEKFLFSSLSDYPLVLSLLKEKGVNAWVNCPRRMFSHYKLLKELLKDEVHVHYSLTGGEWGLACNAIHFIDCFAFTSKLKDYKVTDLELDDEVIESKRAGYIEFTGTIKGTISSDKTFSLTSIKDSQTSPVIIIKSDNWDIEIKETEGEMKLINRKGTSETHHIDSLFQSQLTGVLAKQILLAGNTELTSFEESVHLHLGFLKPLVDFYNEKTGKIADNCPIT